MAKIVEDIGTLKINLLSQAQYDAEVQAGTVEPDELYLTPSSGTGVSDVEVDGESVVSGGVASIDLTGKSDIGHTHTTSAITDFPTLATVATSGSYNDLSNKPTIPTVNNATLTIQKNGTNVQTFTANASSNKTANITVPTAVSELTNDSGFITSSALPTKVSDLTNDAGYITGYTETDPVFSASAASGITSSNISTWNGKYAKPSGGIPKTDLASAVQTSLGKADTALQSFTETDPIFTASAAHGISSSDIDNWDAKQDELVSGVSIRTINGTSVLGSGDIEVAAGGTPIPTADTVAEFDSSACMNSSDMSAQDIEDFVDALNISTPATLVDFFYPIGSYYETSNASFNPNIAWNGTWVLEAEGLVHIGAGNNYTLGDTGGEETHTLTIDEMPQHSHSLPNVFGNFSGATLNAPTGTYQWHNQATATGNKGGGDAHNNMQPYIVVNRWHRTA